MEGMDGGEEGLVGALNKEPVIQVREDGLAKMVHACNYDREHFGEDSWSHRYAKRQHPELVVAGLNLESETFDRLGEYRCGNRHLSCRDT